MGNLGAAAPHRSPVRNSRLRALLDEAGWTHQALAGAVNRVGAETGHWLRYDRSAVAHWLSGTRPQVPELIAEAFSRRLGRIVTRADLGLADANIVVPPPIPDPLGGDDPVAELAELARADADSAGHATLRRWLYSLAALDIPDWPAAQCARPTPGYGCTGQRMIHAGRHMLNLFVVADHSFGSGHARTALIVYLAHDLAASLRTHGTETARRELLGLAADLTCLAGFRCYDDHVHGLAQRYYRLALAFAVQADDPIRYAITVRSLSDQAHYLGHHQHALVLAHRAITATGGTATPHTEAFLHSHAALCHATLGHHHSAAHHQHHAEQHLNQAHDPAPILGTYHPAELGYHTALIRLCFNDHDRARTALRTATRTYPTQHRRSRALALALLTELHLATGHHHLARTSWQRLLSDHTLLRSARLDAAIQRLRPRLNLPHPQKTLPPTN